MIDWPVEPVPDDSALYYRVYIAHLKSRKLHTNVFRLSEEDRKMSTDWSNHSSAEECRVRVGHEKAQNAGVVVLPVGRVRQIKGTTVEHSPDVVRENRAHTSVFPQNPVCVGGKFTWSNEERFELFLACDGRWEIAPPNLAEQS